MHDPQTVAFEIKYPWRMYGRRQRHAGGLGEFMRTYHASFITIWHVDPENSHGKCGVRGDDTCGWFSPPYSEVRRELIRGLGRQQYSTIFQKQWAIGENKDYVRVCYEPTSYDAIYWAWRAIKQTERPRGPWQYGKDLTRAELAEIYSLDANPVDNLRTTVAGVNDAESCADFFLTVYRCYLRFNRPWYRHPRWHVTHWRFQVHPWQTFRRWVLSRCAGCGKRFAWGYCPTSFSWDSKRPKRFRGEEGVYHSECADRALKLQREPAQGNA